MDVSVSACPPSGAAGTARTAEGGTSTAGGAAAVPGRRPRRDNTVAMVPPPQREGMRVAGDWPLRSFLELGALPTAPGCARLHAKQVLWEWGLGTLCETVELLVSEIFTNAVRASRGLVAGRFGGQRPTEIPTVRLWLSSDRAAVLIQVWDADHRMPRRQDTEPEAESGRGLLLVDALSAEWGSYVPNGWRGKVVWASVNRTAP
jgi:anti-sigma regulatory factor (Ser/Thr protein kinase)